MLKAKIWDYDVCLSYKLSDIIKETIIRIWNFEIKNQSIFVTNRKISLNRLLVKQLLMELLKHNTLG
jgi:hypothetical protein